MAANRIYAGSGRTREEISGRILPMDRPPGEPGIIAGTALFAFPILVAFGLIVAFS